MNPNKYNLRHVDVSLLGNPQFVAFLAAQPSNVIVYAPAKAAEIAQMVQAVVTNVPGPWLKKFTPFLAVKTCNQPDVIRSIFASGFKPDIATSNEARLAQWASGGLYTPADMGFSNMWVGEAQIYDLVAIGVRNFVVDKKNVADWIVAAAQQFGKDPKDFQITIRVMLGDSKGGQGQKFGLPIHLLPDMADYIRKQFGHIADGVAFHLGTSNSYEYMNPQLFGMSHPIPSSDLFDNYARAIEIMAAVCNQLHGAGLLGDTVNTEGGLRPSYGIEYDWADVLRSQAQAFSQHFQYPITWQIEPGRLFAPCSLAKLTVTNLDLEARSTGYPYAAVEGSLYVGFHDFQWEYPTIVRQSDIQAGNIYTPHTHPDKFGKYILVGSACAGSDQWGIRANREYTLLPADIKPGDIILMFPAGAYTAGGLGPQGFQTMEGHVHNNYGFNGIEWPKCVIYNGTI